VGGEVLKYKRSAFAVLLVVLILLTSCNIVENISQIDDTSPDESDSFSENEAVYGGHIVLPLTKINSLNPLTVNNESYFYFSKLIFESLFDFDKNFQVTKELVENYTFKSDNVVSIKLKDNVYWHDGEKLKAEDVAFTINTIKYASDETAYKKMWKEFVGDSNYTNLNRIMEARIIDDLNIEIVFDSRVANKLEILTFPIIPRHKFVDGVESAQAYRKALEEENYIPIGTGPYKFVSFQKSKSIELVYNEDYRNGRPYIEKITGKILQNNDLILTAFEAGQVDVAVHSGFDWDKFSENSSVRIIEFVSQRCELLGFNFKNEFFNKYGPGLRRAFAYGIDRQTIIENVYFGHATQSDLPIHPDSWVLSGSSNIYGFNMDKARQELEKLGWEDRDLDGYYEDEDGKDITLRLITNSYNPLRQKTADLIVENLNQLGIHVVKDYPDNIPDNLTEKDIAEQWNNVKEKVSKGDFDIALLGWNLSPVPDLTFAFPYIGYNNDVMNEALAQLNSSNEEGKLKAHERVQSIILQDLPYISLFFKNQALLINNKIRGNIDPTFYDIYRNIEEWYIPKNLQ
jgi:peptide/nickel transport system substrate-binding protein